MKIWLLTAILLVGATAEAAVDFETTYGGPDFDRGVFVSPTEDGGYIAVGATKSVGEGAEDVYLVRTDAVGEKIWSRTYGGTAPDFGWSVHEIDGGFIIAGFTQSSGQGDYDFYLIRTDSAGTSQWSRTFGGQGKDRCWSLLPTRDGGFALAGETTSSGSGEEDFYLVKTDSLGAVLWSRTYGGEKGDRCFSIAQADDGGFVLAGQTFSEGAGDRDVYIVKTTADGTSEWTRTFGGPASDVGHSVIATADSTFLVTGYTTSLAAQDDDPYLIRIDAKGRTRWTRVLPLEGAIHTLTGDQAVDGGFYLTGFSVQGARESKRAVLVKTDPEGKFVWRRDFPPADAGESFGYTVRATEDGGCVFTGHASGGQGHLDLLLVGVGNK